MEKLFLGALLAREELNVVDKECVERAVQALELGNAVVLKALDHVANKSLRVHIANPRPGVGGEHGVANALHEVGLAKTDAAVNKQRVVRGARVGGNLAGGGAGELVTLALDEVGKRKRGVEPRRHLRAGGGSRRRGRRRLYGRFSGADLDDDGGAGSGIRHQLFDSAQVVLLQPVDDEAVGGEQAQIAAILDRL